MSTTLTLGEHSVTLQGPSSGQPVDGPSRFVISRAADGTQYSYQLNSSATRTWRMRFELTLSEFVSLETFFYDVAKGPTNSFSLTSSSGRTYTGVRFSDVALSADQQCINIWGVTLNFTLDAKVAKAL